MKIEATIFSANIRALKEMVPENNLEVFKQDVVICVLDVYMGFCVLSIASSSGYDVVERTIETFERLDTFDTTTIACHCPHRSRVVGVTDRS